MLPLSKLLNAPSDNRLTILEDHTRGYVQAPLTPKVGAVMGGQY